MLPLVIVCCCVFEIFFFFFTSDFLISGYLWLSRMASATGKLAQISIESENFPKLKTRGEQ